YQREIFLQARDGLRIQCEQALAALAPAAHDARVFQYAQVLADRLAAEGAVAAQFGDRTLPAVAELADQRQAGGVAERGEHNRGARRAPRPARPRAALPCLARPRFTRHGA